MCRCPTAAAARCPRGQEPKRPRAQEAKSPRQDTPIGDIPIKVRISLSLVCRLCAFFAVCCKVVRPAAIMRPTGRWLALYKKLLLFLAATRPFVCGHLLPQVCCVCNCLGGLHGYCQLASRAQDPKSKARRWLRDQSAITALSTRPKSSRSRASSLKALPPGRLWLWAEGGDSLGSTSLAPRHASAIAPAMVVVTHQDVRAHRLHVSVVAPN